MHVGYWSLVKQVAEALFALCQRLARMTQRVLGAQSFQFGPRPGGKDSHDCKPARSVPHRPLRQDREVTDNGSGSIKQGNPAIALDTPFLKDVVSREALSDLLGMMRGLAVQNCFAWSTGEGKVEVFHETSASPYGARPKS